MYIHLDEIDGYFHTEICPNVLESDWNWIKLESNKHICINTQPDDVPGLNVQDWDLKAMVEGKKLQKT